MAGRKVGRIAAVVVRRQAAAVAPTGFAGRKAVGVVVVRMAAEEEVCYIPTALEDMVKMRHNLVVLVVQRVTVVA